MRMAVVASAASRTAATLVPSQSSLIVVFRTIAAARDPFLAEPTDAARAVAKVVGAGWMQRASSCAVRIGVAGTGEFFEIASRRREMARATRFLAASSSVPIARATCLKGRPRRYLRAMASRSLLER